MGNHIRSIRNWLDTRVNPPRVVTLTIGLMGLFAVPAYYYLILPWADGRWSVVKMLAWLRAWPYAPNVYAFLISNVLIIMIGIGIFTLYEFARGVMSRWRLLSAIANDVLIPLVTMLVINASSVIPNVANVFTNLLAIIVIDMMLMVFGIAMLIVAAWLASFRSSLACRETRVHLLL